MKLRNAAAQVALLAVVASCGGCATQHARKAVAPVMRKAWESIRVEVVAEGGDVTAADAALEAETVEAVAAVDWTGLVLLAEQGIAKREAAGEVGETVAEILRERLVQFMRAVRAYTGTEEQR